MQIKTLLTVEFDCRIPKYHEKLRTAGFKLPPTRREMLLFTLAGATATGAASSAFANVSSASKSDIVRVARHALARNSGHVSKTDVVGIANFSSPSHIPRFHLVDLVNGKVSVHHVAHGRGSDPHHTGWVQKFSNEYGSKATSPGAYLTSNLYTGKYGRSMRLVGLDPENSNAEGRAIVIHSAWYVSEDMIRQQGKLGRSEGCFAFSQDSLDAVLTRLGPGRLLLAGKF